MMEKLESTEGKFEDQEVETTSYGCWCFNGVCWGSRKNDGKYNLLGNDELGKEESWIGENLKKLKELSEILAGPKWKNFIRKFGINKRKKMQKVQYDPQSYALNFDDGIDKDLDSVFPNFSARFANPIGNLGVVSNGEL